MANVDKTRATVQVKYRFLRYPARAYAPSMYIGSTSTRGLHQLFEEIVANSIDEAMVGRCDRIDVVINEDCSVLVSDNGGGIPVEIHEKMNKSALEVVMTNLNAGGKFEKSAYKYSAGLHGVGASAVNALSEWCEVRVKTGGRVYRQRYERGKPVTEVEVIGTVPPNDTGTTTIFRPDCEIFESIEFSYDTMSNRLREFAFLNKGVTITLEDKARRQESRVLLQGWHSIVCRVSQQEQEPDPQKRDKHGTRR